ncbi:hypothetical protein D3C87_1005910 [compost metagenome]
MLGGIGSAAISAVPVRANTRSTSGNFAFSRVSICCCIATDCVRLVPGMRSACTAKSPSFRLGMNSLPSRVAMIPLSSTATTAPVSTTGVLASARDSAGAYQRRAQPITRFSFSATRSPMHSATAAGTKVTDRISAPSSASTTVFAIGWNILPSTPVSARIGT